MYIAGCLYLVAQRSWRIFGEEIHSWFVEPLTDVKYFRAICYDEVTYPDPQTYNPSRFLDENGRIDPSVKDPEARVFGSGRRCGASVCVAVAVCLNSFNRICPGRHVALRMLYLTVARVLATFDILPPVDKDGCPRIPEARYNETLVR